MRKESTNAVVQQDFDKLINEIPILEKYVNLLEPYTNELEPDDWNYLNTIEKYHLSSGYKKEYYEFRCSSAYIEEMRCYDIYLEVLPPKVFWFVIRYAIAYRRSEK